MLTSADAATRQITGRCYCGATAIRVAGPPLAVAYCHCADCRRATGAPVAAFAAFDEAAVKFTPNDGHVASPNPGVRRSFCPTCGSPIASRFDYLPGQVYIALGVLDQADALAPQLHAHEAERFPWLHIDDALPRTASSSRDRLAGVVE